MTDQQPITSAPPEDKRVSPSAELPREWKSCCFLVNPQAATFAVQVLFSLFLILFSAFKVSGSVEILLKSHISGVKPKGG